MSKVSIKEWMCRIGLTLNTLLLTSNLLSFIQTEQLLISSLIPQSLIVQVLRSSTYASLYVAALFIPSLWFYFYRKLTVVIVLQALSVWIYYISQYYF